jgi:hypothetical protein
MLLKNCYIAIRDRLKTINELQEVTWYTQQDRVNEQEMFAVPVAYILFDTIELTSLPQKVQMVERKIKFKVRLVSESYQDTEEAILSHLDLVQQIYEALHNYNHKGGDTQLLNTITRTAIKPEHDLSNLLITEQTFEAIAFDYTNQTAYVKRKVGYQINAITVK